MFHATLPFKRYFDFSGRSRRKEYWLYVLFVLVGVAIAAFLDKTFGLQVARSWTSEPGSAVTYSYEVKGGVISGLWGLFTLIPSLAVSIRRLHDTNRAGWWILVNLIPLAGFIVWIVFMCRSGTPGSNRFGPDPKGIPA